MESVNSDLRSVFSALPANYLLLLPNAPDFTIVQCTDNYLLATGVERQNLVGKNLTEVFNIGLMDLHNSGVGVLLQSLNKVISTKQKDVMPLTHYDIPGKTGDFMEKFWNPINVPVIDDIGNISYIVHCVEDTNEKLKRIHSNELSKGFGEEQRRRFKNIILRAPLAVAVLKGPQFIIEAVNSKMCNHWGRTHAELMGRSLYMAIPESRTDEFERMLRNIFISGERFTSKSSSVRLKRNGMEETVFVDFVCEPLFDAFDAVESILVMAYETSVELPK